MFKNLSYRFLNTMLIFCLTMFANYANAQTKWQTLAPGIEYSSIIPNDTANGRIHAFRVDLSKNHLDLALASDLQVAAASVKSMAEKNHALLAVNGGFFSPQLQPLGLRIKRGEIKSKLKFTSWWGIFFINQHKAQIVSQKDYGNSKSAEFAVQGGPRLIVNGTITPKLKSGIAQRTALGITRNGKVIVVATDNAPLDTQTLASIMQAPEAQDGLACFNALNLDGGGSTQLFAQIGKFDLSVPGLSLITDAVMVTNG